MSLFIVVATITSRLSKENRHKEKYTIISQGIKPVVTLPELAASLES
jgi:hypothetical protein